MDYPETQQFLLPLGMQSCMILGLAALDAKQRSAWERTLAHFLFLPFLPSSPFPSHLNKVVAQLQGTQAKIVPRQYLCEFLPEVQLSKELIRQLFNEYGGQ